MAEPLPVKEHRKSREPRTATNGSRLLPPPRFESRPPLPSGGGIKTRHTNLGKSSRRDASARRGGCPPCEIDSIIDWLVAEAGDYEECR